jgi:hypothetical protein
LENINKERIMLEDKLDKNLKIIKQAESADRWRASAFPLQAAVDENCDSFTQNLVREGMDVFNRILSCPVFETAKEAATQKPQVTISCNFFYDLCVDQGSGLAVIRYAVDEYLRTINEKGDTYSLTEITEMQRLMKIIVKASVFLPSNFKSLVDQYGDGARKDAMIIILHELYHVLTGPSHAAAITMEVALARSKDAIPAPLVTIMSAFSSQVNYRLLECLGDYDELHRAACPWGQEATTLKVLECFDRHLPPEITPGFVDIAILQEKYSELPRECPTQSSEPDTTTLARSFLSSCAIGVALGIAEELTAGETSRQRKLIVEALKFGMIAIISPTGAAISLGAHLLPLKLKGGPKARAALAIAPVVLKIARGGSVGGFAANAALSSLGVFGGRESGRRVVRGIKGVRSSCGAKGAGSLAVRHRGR